MSFISYSQNYEDFRLWRTLNHIGNGTYLDIGAYDPVIDSVSAHFYQNGWRGLNIEPVDQIFKNYSILRPEDLSINKAVSNEVGEIDFLEIIQTGLSTPTLSRPAGVSNFESRIIKVPTISLDEALEMLPSVDIHWMKIDVEGYESKVLQSWEKSAKRPWIIVLEATVPTTNVRMTFVNHPTLIERGYNFSYFDGLNEFYVHKEHQFLSAKLCEPISIFDQVTKSQDYINELILASGQVELKVSLGQHLNYLLSIIQEQMLASNEKEFLLISNTTPKNESYLMGIESMSNLLLKFEIESMKSSFFNLETQTKEYESQIMALTQEARNNQKQMDDLQGALKGIQESKTFKVTRHLRFVYFLVLRTKSKFRDSCSLFLSNLMRRSIKRILASIQNNLEFRSLLLKLLPTSLAIKLRSYVRRELYKDMIPKYTDIQIPSNLVNKSSQYQNLLKIWNYE